jgi:hypothetical protein
MRFVIDEDFDNDILRGVHRCMPGLNVVRVQDIGLSGAKDPIILEWAATNQRGSTYARCQHDEETRIEPHSGWPSHARHLYRPPGLAD